MPTLLAIETSTDACSVAIRHQEITQETLVVLPREHNRILLPMIDELLKGLQLTLTDLDAIAFGAGPGSFTGLRLAASVVQGLAFATQKPVIAISSLATLALTAGEYAHQNAPQIILIALDARMGDVYFGAYRYDQGHLITLCEDQLLPLAALAGKLAEFDAGHEIIRVGDSWSALNVPKAHKPSINNLYPHAKAVLALAMKQYEAGNVLAAEQALPVYLRETISWQKWQPKHTWKSASTD